MTIPGISNALELVVMAGDVSTTHFITSINAILLIVAPVFHVDARHIIAAGRTLKQTLTAMSLRS